MREREGEGEGERCRDRGRRKRESREREGKREGAGEKDDLLLPSPQALETIEILEKQLSQEHQLRKAADSYLLKLQTTRQHTVGCMDSVKDAQHSINKHCKAVR